MTAPTDHDLPPLNATPPGLYRHYKGGWYDVIDTVRIRNVSGSTANVRVVLVT